MANEHAKAQMADILETVQEQMRAIAQVQQDRAKIVASATVRKRVTVTVNADYKVIETKFTPDIDDLTYTEIAKAVTEAAQQAATEVARKTQEMMAPLQQERARLPKITELVDDMEGFAIPQPVEASLAPPNSPEREPGSAPEREENTERARTATDSSW
ncbi:YbaB/EbfC family nucleoid-associated protein [Nocardia mangyaensis]|uniref:YbaB/EbfC family nucleoid-associated protein n=1 Tax=Nocardia mangyaensis TaxID=2213200 RepID=UPI002676603D|nr:YbaB/EbfC family nucleoid-associated protein [Nocardia mangyaensis]MDO3647293.1 YbaB/EbfC family nucleoid-associated protein [Nocardia mangyaensis]